MLNKQVSLSQRLVVCDSCPQYYSILLFFSSLCFVSNNGRCQIHRVAYFFVGCTRPLTFLPLLDWNIDKTLINIPGHSEMKRKIRNGKLKVEFN